MVDTKPPLLYVIRKVDKKGTVFGESIVVKGNRLARFRRADTSEIVGEATFTTPTRRGNVRVPRQGEVSRGRPKMKPQNEENPGKENANPPTALLGNDPIRPTGNERYDLPAHLAEFEPPITGESSRVLRSAAKQFEEKVKEKMLEPKPLPTKGRLRKRYT